MRNFTFLIASVISLIANNFENNCVQCHFQNKQLQMIMSRYTLKYSSEERIKKAMIDFLRNPTSDTSVMPIGFINRWGMKEPTKLSDEVLIKSVDEYFKEYTLKNYLK